MCFDQGFPLLAPCGQNEVSLIVDETLYDCVNRVSAIDTIAV